MSWQLVPGPTLPSPVCSWDRLQHSSRNSAREKAVKNNNKKKHSKVQIIQKKSPLCMLVSLALLKLHCVSKIASSHLCLQSIPHLHRELHTPALSAIAYATNSISPLPDGSIELQCHPPPFSASHSMYRASLLQGGNSCSQSKKKNFNLR